VLFIPVIKAAFIIITPVFSVTWSYRNYYNMMLKKHLWLLSMFFTCLFQDYLMN